MGVDWTLLSSDHTRSLARQLFGSYTDAGGATQIPLPLFFSSYIYPKGGFTAWIIVTFVWVFCASRVWSAHVRGDSLISPLNVQMELSPLLCIRSMSRVGL